MLFKTFIVYTLQLLDLSISNPLPSYPSLHRSRNQTFIKQRLGRMEKSRLTLGLTSEPKSPSPKSMNPRTTNLMMDGERHDSVIYSRSERPADSVHLHARSVPANLGRRISERMGRLTLGPYWPASRSKCVGRVSRFKCTGQWVSILAHGLVCISIFGCSQDVRHKLTKIVQLIIRSKRLGQPHVQNVWAERHLSSARANGSPY